MKRSINFAIGNIHKWGRSENRTELFQYLKHLPIDGVEITLATKRDLYAFNLSKEDEKWLRSFKWVSIHAPFRLVRKADNEEEVIKQLEVLFSLYKRIDAQNVVIHPLDLPAPEILNKFSFKVSTENMPKHKRVSIADFKKIFKKYPKVGLCLDVSHAYLCSEGETEELLKTFGKRITQIHFSGAYRNNDHQSLGVVTKKFFASIKPIFNLEIPIVIEIEIVKKSKKLLEKEVNLVRNLFCREKKKIL